MKNINPIFILSLIEKALGIKNLQAPIGIHEPCFKDSNAWIYLKDCIDSNWVSSSGKWLDKFESLISDFTGSPEVVLVSNGTDALRLAFHLVGVKRDDEVMVPSFSFVGTCNAIAHLGAVPHFIDVEKSTLGLDPIVLQKTLEKIGIKKGNKLINKESGRQISAICPVHVFGNPADSFKLKAIADKWSLPMIEDAAEALGSFISNIHCGLIGDIGILSFNGNKIITTGGGGALLFKNKELASRARHLANTAKISHPYNFYHDEVGWNDRLPNLNAALGVSQIETLKRKIELKKALFLKYSEVFKDIPGISILKNNLSNSISNNWLITLSINFQDLDKAISFKSELLKIAHERKIFLRPAWNPLHTLPMYKNCPRSNLDITNEMNLRLINLPSSPQLAESIE